MRRLPMRGRSLALLGVLVVFAAFAASVALAADAAPTPKDAPAQSKTLFDIINAGGVLGYFILFLNTITIGLAIENFVSIRRSVIMPTAVLVDIENCFEKQEYSNAITICEEQPTPFTTVISAGLSRVNLGHKQIQEAMDNAREEETARMQQKIGWLALIANQGPMLGLMGTVVSMILAFGQIAGATAPKASELADSIQYALVNTFIGLATAVIAQTFFHYFKNKAQKLMLEVNATASELMSRFSPVE